jgi:hypothetical protein
MDLACYLMAKIAAGLDFKPKDHSVKILGVRRMKLLEEFPIISH